MPPAALVAVVVAVIVFAVLLLGGRWWLARQRWALARERARAAQLSEALAAARAAQADAERAAEAAARTLAVAGHDLRQPAHAIGLYLAALEATPLPEAARELLPRLAASRAALEALLAPLADVSRLDAGAETPRWETVALAPLLQRLADEFAPAAESKGLRLSLRIADRALLTITDPRLLERVLRNLLANAVRHTGRGGVLLACRRRRGDDGHARVRIEVWDTGPGIAEAERERVFEAFEQGAAGGRGGAGQGLGLAIVRRLVVLLGLQVRLRSRPGRGSVFLVDGLPPAGAAPRAVAATRARLARLAGVHVAVLDGDPSVLDATARLLGAWDCRVDAAADAATLLQHCPQRPQVLLLDARFDGGALAPLVAAWGGLPPRLVVGGAALARPVSPPALRAALEQCAAEAGPVAGLAIRHDEEARR